MITRYDRWDIEGITFDELDDLIATLTASGGGGATPTATATPKATATPSPGSRTAQIGGDWYVIDGSGTPVSPPYNTKSEAMYAAQYIYPAATSTPVPQTTPAPTSTGGPSLDPGIYSQDLLAMADVGAGMGSGGVGAPPSSPPTTPPAPRTTGTSSPGTSGGGTTSAKSPAVPPEIQGLLDSFEGFSDKDVVNAYYAGEITRDQLAALITVRNTSEKGVPKYTTASLDRYLTQVDADKPEPKRTALDVLGERFGNISRDFNVKAPEFGAKGAFASSTTGSLPSNNLFTPTSGRQGLVPFSTPGGNTGLAGAVVDNQLYPNRGATVESGINAGQLNYSGSPASILAQNGVYLGDSSFATQMQALGNLIALREFFMEQNPSLSHSQATDLATGTMQPKNPNQDPSASALANWADAPPSYAFAKGGGMMLKEPTMGVGMVTGRPQFIAAEAGNQERVESEGNGLRFTPTDKALPEQANAMAQGRAFGQRGMEQRRMQMIPERQPTQSMLALMRLLGIPGFATGGYYDGDTLSRLTNRYESHMRPTYTSDGSYDYATQAPPVYAATALSPGSPVEEARRRLLGEQAEARQGELNQYNAALNDVSGIANIGALQRQRDAYDYRYGLAGMQTPVEVAAPLTGAMAALPPGVRYALETPADRLLQLFGLNEQQRKISMDQTLASIAEEAAGGGAGTSYPTVDKPPERSGGVWKWDGFRWVWDPF